MQRHPSRPSVRRVFRAAIEKILRDPTHPQYHAFQKEFAKYQSNGAMNYRRAINKACWGAGAAYLGGSERWLRRLLERGIVPRIPAYILGN